ncbi:MAG TPA: thrombospondin type 3 repeat-containing protein [bacterium]|nr:thrombospondin type 3 repeat-containing protein [bacterium]
MVSLKRVVRGCLVAVLMLAASGFVSKAEAAWGDIYCDIFNSSGSALEKAISLYNESDESDRACEVAVRIFAPGTINLPNGLSITQAPPSGHSFGLAIRKCVSTGGNAESGCPSMSNTDVVIDATGYTQDNGDCPIKVFSGAKMDFINFKLKVKNPEKAICTGAGVPIAVEDQTNPFAWIHNVTIVGADGNPTPETNCDDGEDNDHDGKVDCEDTDCSANPSLCPSTETNCNDGNDDDHDGETDCDDSDCASNPACAPTPESNCNDGVDNDGDTKVDCDDTDCIATTACTSIPEANCNDGVDNDGDTKTDCDDTDCIATPACTSIPEANCTDGVDNDSDTTVDCLDTDCAANPACTGAPETNCNDGVDNDGDGQSDCDDTDCAADPACGPVNPTAPDCDLTAAVAVAGFDLTWTSTNGTTAALSDGMSTLSNDLNHPVALNVVPVSPTTYTLTVDGAGGTQCVRAVLLTPGDPVPPALDCNLSSTAAGDGYDLTWTSANGSAAELTEEGNVTPLSTDLNSAAAVHVTPAGTKHYTLEVTGAGGLCSSTISLTTGVCADDGDCDGLDDDVDLCPTESGPAANGGCPTTKCISQVDGTPQTKSGTDADGDGIDAACDTNDTPGSVPTAPTCDLVAVAAVTGFDLTWTSTNGTTASLSDGTTTLSTDLNQATALNVVPGVTPKTYTLSVDGAGGHCGDAITLVDGSPVPTAPTCALNAVSATDGYDLTWTSSDGTSAELTEEGTATPLSTDLNSAAAVHVTPASAKLYNLEVTGGGGICSKGIVLAPGVIVPGDSDGDGIVDSVDNCPALSSHDLTDTDGDGLGNPCDDDDDGDTVLDTSDNCPVIANTDQADRDENGVGDACQIGGSGSVGDDSDGDGLPDDLEEPVFGTDPNNPDTDGDGLNDGEEVQSPFYPACGPTDPDCDDDGVCDGANTVTDGAGGIICQPVDGHGDNCRLVSNGPNTSGIDADEIQADSDGNGVGDVCEGDMDGDGVPDDTDNCSFQPNPKQDDVDSNGIGDVCDPNFAFTKGGGGAGCGCRMDGQSSNSDAVGFLLLGLPLVFLRRLRRQSEIGSN